MEVKMFWQNLNKLVYMQLCNEVQKTPMEVDHNPSKVNKVQVRKLADSATAPMQYSHGNKFSNGLGKLIIAAGCIQRMH